MTSLFPVHRLFLVLLYSTFGLFVLVDGQTQSFFSQLSACALPCAGNETQRLACSPLDSTCVCQKVVGAALYDCFASECIFESDVQASVASVEQACANYTADPSCFADKGDGGYGASLSRGAIAGIVVGVTVGVAGLCTISFLLGVRKKRSRVAMNAEITRKPEESVPEGRTVPELD